MDIPESLENSLYFTARLVQHLYPRSDRVKTGIVLYNLCKKHKFNYEVRGNKVSRLWPWSAVRLYINLTDEELVEMSQLENRSNEAHQPKSKAKRKKTWRPSNGDKVPW